jgi:predicted glutamine amidotransferase
MCQLLAMNSSKPAALGLSFEGFAERDGRTGAHKDGWGTALHCGDGYRLYTDELASIDSPLAASIKRHPVKARNIVAHIRKATTLVDCDLGIDLRRRNHLDDRIAVIATEPLTSNERWTAFAPGELKMFGGGRALARGADAAQAPRWRIC